MPIGIEWIVLTRMLIRIRVKQTPNRPLQQWLHWY